MLTKEEFEKIEKVAEFLFRSRDPKVEMVDESSCNVYLMRFDNSNKLAATININKLSNERFHQYPSIEVQYVSGDIATVSHITDLNDFITFLKYYLF